MKATRGKTGSRRSHHGVTPPRLSACGKCGGTHERHHACPQCGEYRGRQVLNVAKKEAKRARKQKEQEKQ